MKKRRFSVTHPISNFISNFDSKLNFKFYKNHEAGSRHETSTNSSVDETFDDLSHADFGRKLRSTLV